MVRPILTALLLIVAATAFAQPAVTGISPLNGPTSGGTEITITGSGFQAPVEVWFANYNLLGQIRARSTKVVNSTTIVATTPAYPAGAARVVVRQGGASVEAQGQFVYVGSDADAFQRYLVPTLAPPVAGANGSEFQSVLRLWNPGTWDVVIGGLPRSGIICDLCPAYPLFNVIEPGAAPNVSSTMRGDWPARWLDVANDDGSLVMNLRVYETRRSGIDFGTEIPIVPLGAFRNRIDLPGVPFDSRYRLTLRVYGEMEGVVGVSFRSDFRIVSLAPSAPGYVNGPSYVEVPLPQARLGQRTTVDMSIIANPGGIVASPALSRIWAFVTVTNNETQHITTITPQPPR